MIHSKGTTKGHFVYLIEVHFLSDFTKTKLQKEGIFFLIHLLAKDILLMKKLEIEETKITNIQLLKLI